MGEIEIRQLDKKDSAYEEARALYCYYLGLNPTFEDPEQIFWAAFDGDTVVGASSLVLEFEENEENEDVEELEGLLEGIVVDEKYRGQQIGERLTRARIDYAVAAGAKYLTSLIWCHPEPANSKYILEKFGLVGLEYIENAYVDEIPSDRWAHCPKCGTACTCGGLFMACKVI